MLHPDEALEIVLRTSAAVRTGTEAVPLGSALGRALPSGQSCGVDQPPFDKSIMDGFAYRSRDGAAARPGERYRIVGATAAGDAAAPPLGAGDCVRIMTGAPIPEGAVAVQKVEDVSEEDGFAVFTRTDADGNILRRGTYKKAGDALLDPRVLGPADLGILASDGRESVTVARRPVVAVLSTGSELVRPGRPLGEASIYDSNRVQLLAMAQELGCTAVDLGIVKDDEADTAAALDRALQEADLVLVSGGVSMGIFDFVPAACARVGVEKRFHKIALKPGKPIFFGVRGQRFVFALPGNPLSAFLGFELFVKPLLGSLVGLRWKPRFRPCRLDGALRRKTEDRVEYYPVRIDGPRCAPLPFGGSSMLSVLASADGLAKLELGQEHLESGATIDVRCIR